jgi:Putative DNA-binding domain
MQAEFAAALLDPDAAVPGGLVDPFGRPAPKRFSVYRNNVASSLTRALEAAFPTVRKLVGDEFFAAMAGVFLRAHPPTSRMMMLYGDALPGWLKTFPPVAHLGYLPDVARLDQAMRESYHAADADPLSQGDLQRLTGTGSVRLRLTLAPSLRLIRSPWPIQSIWAANAENGTAPHPGAEAALVLRPLFDPRPHRLSPPDGAFVQGLQEGLTLEQSLDLAGAGVGLSDILSLLVSGRAIVGASE